MIRKVFVKCNFLEEKYRNFKNRSIVVFKTNTNDWNEMEKLDRKGSSKTVKKASNHAGIVLPLTNKNVFHNQIFADQFVFHDAILSIHVEYVNIKIY